MKKSRPVARRLLVVLALLGSAVIDTALLGGQAHAIIGRPLTPLSYAGVARRTTRRAVVGTAMVASPRYW
jgi:hypothetical protein